MSINLTNPVGQGAQAAQQYSTTALEQKLQNKDFKNAKDDELMEAVKSFESYFVEQVIKEVEKTIHTEDKDSYAAQMTDYFKDTVIKEVSEKIIDQSGNNFTQKLYEQMRRNVGLPAVEDKEADAVSAAEKTAGANKLEDEEEVTVTVLE